MSFPNDDRRPVRRAVQHALPAQPVSVDETFQSLLKFANEKHINYDLLKQNFLN